MKLTQAQVWKVEDGFVRVVRVERLAVDYKLMPTLAGEGGTHLRATKKEFCRLLKGAVLLDPEVVALGSLPPA